MVRKINGKEIMTRRKAMEKYRESFIGFVATERNLTDQDNEKGYVVCVMDSYDEGFTIPRKTDDNRLSQLYPDMLWEERK